MLQIRKVEIVDCYKSMSLTIEKILQNLDSPIM